MVTKTEVALRDWIIAVTGLPFLFVGGVETLGLWIAKVVGHCNQGSVGHPSRHLGDSGEMI